MSVTVNERVPQIEAKAREPLIRLEGIKKYFPITRGILFQKHVGDVHAVDGVIWRSIPARRSASWERPAAASPRSRAS